MLSFNCVSGKLNLTDPCYDADPSDRFGVMFSVPAKRGKWFAKVEKTNGGSWGIRCASLTAYAEGFRYPMFPKFKEVGLFVDSGQLGIFDSSTYEAPKDGDEPFDFDNPKTHYEMCCHLTGSEEGYGVLANGVVSRSGYGDGCYSATLWYIEDESGTKELVKVEITFIEEEEEEDYDNWDGEDYDDGTWE